MLVKYTHQEIKDLLRSAECTIFLEDIDISSHEAGDRGDTLIRKIIVGVFSPIIPITIKKQIDGRWISESSSVYWVPKRYFLNSLMISVIAETRLVQWACSSPWTMK